jgi:hypothetical protein
VELQFRRAIATLALPCQLHCLAPQQSFAQIVGIEIQRLTDIGERKKIFVLLVKDPFLGLIKDPFFARIPSRQIFLKAPNRVFQNRSHEFLFWLEASCALERGQIPRWGENIWFEQ